MFKWTIAGAKTRTSEFDFGGEWFECGRLGGGFAAYHNVVFVSHFYTFFYGILTGRYVFAYFALLVHLGIFSVIEVHFLPVGHTHEVIFGSS